MPAKRCPEPAGEGSTRHRKLWQAPDRLPAFHSPAEGRGGTAEHFFPISDSTKAAVGGAGGGGPQPANTLRYLGAGALPKGCAGTTTPNWCQGGSHGFCRLPGGKGACFAFPPGASCSWGPGGSCSPRLSLRSGRIPAPTEVPMSACKPPLLSPYCFSLSRLALLRKIFFQVYFWQHISRSLFPQTSCWSAGLPSAGQHRTEVFSSRQALGGGGIKAERQEKPASTSL